MSVARRLGGAKLSRMLSAMVAVSAMTMSAAGTAAEFPSKPITMIVAFPAGGGSDIIARLLSEPLSRALGQPIIVENVSGGTGAIGAAKLARQAPDGYTVMLGSVNENVLSPLVNPDVAKQYSSEDFDPIAKVGSSAFVITGRKDFPAVTIDEVVQDARERPGELSFGTTGVGSYQQIVMNRLQQLTDTSLLHVPYRGGAPMMTDLIGGQIDFAVGMPNMMLPQIERGALKAFAVTGLKRDPTLPNVPSVVESKEVSKIDYVFWFGLFAPKGVPADRLEKLKQAATTTFADPEVIKRLEGVGIVVPSADEQAEFSQFVRSERDKLQSAVATMKLN